MHLLTGDLLPLDKCITAQNYLRTYVEVQEYNKQMYFYLHFEETLIFAKSGIILK